MKYLWIGICINEEIKEYILANKGKMMSAKVSQDNWVAGLDALGIDMDSINSIYFPLSIKKVERTSWSRNGNSFDVNVAHKNGKYSRIMSKKHFMRKEAAAWAKKNKNENVTVFVYSMHSPFIAAALEVKRIIPTAKIVMLVPDLPQFMHLTMSKTKRFLKALDWQYIKRAIKKIDKFALYSKHMADFLKLKDGTWCVLEGSINQNDVLNEEPQKDNNIISVMYSGVADTRYGLPELLDAFSLIKQENYELWITGIGNAVPLIKERAQNDNRIKYLGFLPSRKDLLLKQKSASMMINVRKPEEKASAYCFPSKLFEYMISGSPVLSFKIPGIPDEYFDYIIPMKNSEPQNIADAILQIGNMKMEERELLGKKSREFVLENKNKNAQAEKLLKFAIG